MHARACCSRMGLHSTDRAVQHLHIFSQRFWHQRQDRNYGLDRKHNQLTSSAGEQPLVRPSSLAVCGGGFSDGLSRPVPDGPCNSSTPLIPSSIQREHGYKSSQRFQSSTNEQSADHSNPWRPNQRLALSVVLDLSPPQGPGRTSCMTPWTTRISLY